MKVGDLVKHVNDFEDNPWFPFESEEYIAALSELQSQVGVIVSVCSGKNASTHRRVLVQWIDINRQTYENTKYLEVIS